ncbi:MULTISPECIES: hypothetical protein [unclassified Salinivibrio]|uniref:hypothetical protein n=1 Tax=unclassified Salinivibrio TaxID=2636825 RepID=UPI00128C59BB|nr:MULTISPECIES: hypothetical protein [unclassified Salinivibrio]MPS31253.1 hypothetical protein [Salinivibrio sp. VYel7]MPX92653.1 hypothetical protein [Salinivibrio sp. VYel9]MPX95663.1 hypothetical protein [Salinivibrio sp. VYel6]MPY01292.1 hypothetical protein [Salinivibrio sp. VYel4]MPY02423.1 hypothetical protein [Salinivibrio sp. VYel5]
MNNLKIDVETYIKALENEYYIDLYSAGKRSLSFKCFRPESYSNLITCIVKYVFYMLSLPMGIFFCRLTLSQSITNKAYFICSEKSRNIYADAYSSDYFGFIDKRLKFHFSLVDTYYFFVLSFAFLKRFKFSFWFYPEIALIPEMIRVNRFLEKADIEDLYITNQYDRWAYFLSSLQLGYKVHVSQHGLVTNSYTPKNKIGFINSLVCFSNEQKIIFEEKIVKEIGQVIIRPPNLYLTPDLGECSVLLCCTSDKQFFSVEKEIYDALRGKEKINVSVKPHPNNKSAYSNFEDVVISDSFPKVRVIIHFNSTLEIEYKNTDPDVVALNAAAMSSREVIEIVFNLLL